MSGLEALIRRVREEAARRGSGWLEECLESAAAVPGPAVSAERRTSGRRSRRPERLSPEVVPRARRRHVSPSRDPPAPAAVSGAARNHAGPPGAAESTLPAPRPSTSGGGAGRHGDATARPSADAPSAGRVQRDGRRRSNSPTGGREPGGSRKAAGKSVDGRRAGARTVSAESGGEEAVPVRVHAGRSREEGVRPSRKGAVEQETTGAMARAGMTGQRRRSGEVELAQGGAACPAPYSSEEEVISSEEGEEGHVDVEEHGRGAGPRSVVRRMDSEDGALGARGPQSRPTQDETAGTSMAARETTAGQVATARLGESTTVSSLGGGGLWEGLHSLLTDVQGLLREQRGSRGSPAVVWDAPGQVAAGVVEVAAPVVSGG